MFTTVQNGQLQGQPSISYQVGANLITDHPNQQGNEALHNLRRPDKAASLTPVDVEGIDKRVGIYENSGGNVRAFRGKVLERGSYVFPGISEPHMLRFERDTAAEMYEAMFGDGDPSIITEGAEQYEESEHFDTDYMVVAETTENGWEFNQRPDLEMGDPW